MSEPAATTLTEFLLVRIAEDEAWARARQREAFLRHRLRARSLHLEPDDPARVLAECEAKRQIVERWASDDHQGYLILCALALPYADHPDYRDEWRP